MIRGLRRWPALYAAWIVLCALIFFALRNADDPSRPKGRILSIEAGQRALIHARAHGLTDLTVVHVARARAGEGGSEERWIVLLDRIPPTRLRGAVVVEVKVSDGRLIGMRRPAER